MFELKDIVDNLECVCDELDCFLDTQTGEIIPVSDEEVRSSERGDDAESATGPQVRSILENKNDRFVKLPGAFEVHEWAIIEAFCRTIADPKVFSEFDFAIHGSGAFRNFRNCLEKHSLEQQWFDYKRAALREIAITWCTENGLKCRV